MRTCLIVVALVSLVASAASPVAVPLLAAPVGDPAAGELVYENCTGCHSVETNRVGPLHKGIVGRLAGTVPGYDYSPALKAAGFVWDEPALDRWLANSKEFVPGSRMGFRLSSPADRADVIAYLRTLR